MSRIKSKIWEQIRIPLLIILAVKVAALAFVLVS